MIIRSSVRPRSLACYTYSCMCICICKMKYYLLLVLFGYWFIEIERRIGEETGVQGDVKMWM
jgi:hypothetical protein